MFVSDNLRNGWSDFDGTYVILLLHGISMQPQLDYFQKEKKNIYFYSTIKTRAKSQAQLVRYKVNYHFNLTVFNLKEQLFHQFRITVSTRKAILFINKRHQFPILSKIFSNHWLVTVNPFSTVETGQLSKLRVLLEQIDLAVVTGNKKIIRNLQEGRGSNFLFCFIGF